jgi:hypothetical protein
MPIRSARRVTTLSVHYCKPLACYEIAIEANDGTTYLGRHYGTSLRDFISFIARKINEIESTELEKGGDQIACNKG